MKIAIVETNDQNAQLLKNNIIKIDNTEVVNIFENLNNDFSNVDLVIFDVSSKNSEDVIIKINEIKSKNKNISFIATSFEINSSLVSQILKEGVSDFLLKPIIPNVLENSIKKINQNNKIKKAKTLCVFSNKGGVGKTSTAINLGYEINKSTNEKVCILDLSFNSENATMFLNLEQKNPIEQILEKIETSNKETILSMITKYENNEFYILEAQEEITTNLKFTPQKINKIINHLKNIFDYIIIDTTNIINETTISIFSACDLILLLGLTNTTSIKNWQKCYELFDKIGYDNDKIKLIINRYIQNQDESNINHEIFAKIPNNYLTLSDAINQGKCVSELNPQSNIAKAYKKLANDILNIDFETINFNKNYNHGIFNILRRMGEE